MITQPQAQALASLLHELRPEWVTGSILTLLWEHRDDDHKFSDLCAAAIAVANDSSKRTPAIIWMDGPHWHPAAAQTAPRQQFLTSAEKSHLQGARLMGYYCARDGRDISNPSDPLFRDLIGPGDLNPAATMDAYKQGYARYQWELDQQQPASIEAVDPDTLEEAP